MKKVMSILTILLLALSCFSCQKPELSQDIKEKYLKEEIRYDQNEREIDKRTFTYDERGNFTSIIDNRGESLYEYEEDRVTKASVGGVVSTYSYNENKKLIEVVKTKDGDNFGTIKYEYDALDNLIKMITQKEGTEVLATYTYNKDNQVIEALLNLDNKEYKTKLEYDKDGNCIKETKYSDGVIESEITSVFEKGVLIKQKHDNQKEQTFVELQYEYTEDKQVIKELTSYDGDPFFKSREYIYE